MTICGVELSTTRPETGSGTNVLVLKFGKEKCCLRLNPDEFSMLNNFIFRADERRKKEGVEK
jgi:hypothetical protein